jgi:N-acyl homoserine lactone hydrolase
MRIDGFEVDIIVQGYPGKSVCHGGLGWSTIALLRGEGRVALVDVGSFSQRQLVLDALKARGLGPADVTDVVLTHSHWDHAINWVMFPKARVAIGAAELDWALAQPRGLTPVAELYIAELQRSAQRALVRDGDEVLPGLRAHAAPGHTPGSLVFVLSGATREVIFTGDAAKNRAELLSRTADLTVDQATSRRSFDRIWELWRRRPATVLIPGHDVPMVLEDGRPVYLDERRAAITAWFGDTLETTRRFELTLAQGVYS